MNLVFADPSLRLKIDHNTAWYHYVVPELQTYWAVPLIFAHSECALDMDLPQVLTTWGQEKPSPMKVRGLFRHNPRDNASGRLDLIVRETAEDLERITGLGTYDCLYLREAGLPHILALGLWLESFKSSVRPRAIIQPASSYNWENLTGLESGKAADVLCRLEAWIKIATPCQSLASELEAQLRCPVECWPSPQRCMAKRQRRQGTGRLIAILGAEDADPRDISHLVSSLLDSRTDAAVMVHDSRGGALAFGLKDFEARNPRLVVLKGPILFEGWHKLLSSIDLAIIPAEPAAWLLDELFASGVPTVASTETKAARNIESAGADGFHSTIEAVLADPGRAEQQAATASECWTNGAQRIALNILSWFPKTRPQWQGWVERTIAPPMKSEYRSKRILLSWSVDPAYIPPPIFSDRQVTIGPHPLATSKTHLRPNQGRTYDAYTPYLHTYDLKTTLELQGISGPFDLVIVFAESTFGNVPLNLQSLGCPSLLFAGDTHWGTHAIQRMVDYSVTGGFDYVASTYNRQHLHWYLESGKQQVAWIPAMATDHFDVPFQANRRKQVAFVGQTQDLHARRIRLLARLRKSGLPLNQQSLSRQDAAAFYASSALSLNASLNGDLNLRTFEVLSAGGCLLTDRLAPESGQSLVFKDGLDFLSYSSEGEMLKTIADVLSDSRLATEIARHGHETYMRRFLPRQQLTSLLDWVFSGELREEYGSAWDVRPQLAEFDPLTLAARIALYEDLQELHRVKETVRVLVGPGVPLCVIGDMIDLPRLKCSVLGMRSVVKPILDRYGLGDRVAYVESAGAAQSNAKWSVLIRAYGTAPDTEGIPYESVFEVESSPHNRLHGDADICPAQLVRSR